MKPIIKKLPKIKGQAQRWEVYDNNGNLAGWFKSLWHAKLKLDSIKKATE